MRQPVRVVPPEGLGERVTWANQNAPEVITTAIVWGAAAVAPILTSVAGLFLARGLGAPTYGQVAYYFSIVGFVVLLGGMGLTTQVTTVVARHSSTGLEGAVPWVTSLASARMITLAFIGSAALLFGIAGNGIARAAGLTACVVLLSGFTHGIVRGMGKARLAATLQGAQALVYLVAVLAWARNDPPRVYLATAGSYGFSLAASLPACRPLLDTCLRFRARVRPSLRSIAPSSASVYLLSLLLAPFASVAVLALGTQQRFGDAALFSAALTLALAQSTALSLVVSIQYYPRACQLSATRDGGWVWFDTFYRPFAALSIALVATQIVFPTDVIAALFTSRYSDAAESLRWLSGAGGFLTLGQLAVWTLFAHGRVRCALRGTAAQLALLLAAVAVASCVPTLPLWMLGVGHSLAAGVGLAIYAVGIKRLDSRYQLHGRRLAVALLAAVAAELTLRNLELAMSPEGNLSVFALALPGLLALLVAAAVLTPRLLTRLPRHLSAALLGAVLGLGPGVASAGGATASPTAGCNGIWQAAETRRPVMVVDCRPGFASAHDRISVYSRAPVSSSGDWRDSLNLTDAVWVFDAGCTGRASLVVDFHPNRQSAGVVADLYDDQDGDGRVTVGIRDGVPYAAESTYPTVTVTAPAGWWLKDGKVNFNLDLTVDGPVYAAFNADQYLDRLESDGRPDFEITVRDTRDNGRPDFEAINAWPDAPNSRGIDRTQLMVNTVGNEAPISDALFWPYLGTAFDAPGGASGSDTSTRPVRATPEQSYGFVKGYGRSFPPIQVYWPAGKIAYVGEFVASRGNSANWFLYSISRLGPGQPYANFENPFAFYDLANARDGYPDLQIRDEYFGPGDRFVDQGHVPTASNVIRYSWDQFHQHHWDFKVDLLGRNAIDSTVHLPIGDVRTVPYASYPSWVVGHSWDVADFVAMEAPDAWTSEGIYESLSATTAQRDTFLSGERPTPIDPDLQAWPVGFRGEFSLNFHARPWLYFSSVDHKLHLLKAQAGIWKLDHEREIRLANLGGDYLNEWSLVENGNVTKSLAFVGNRLILADGQGVRIKAVAAAPASFTILPPTSHEDWLRLGGQIARDQPSFTADDFSAMFDQFSGPVQALPGATLSDLSATPDGFHFSLRLPSALPRDATWTSGLQPGAYRVDYRDGTGYSAEPLQPAPLQLSPVSVTGPGAVALQPVVLVTTVRNPGGEDRQNVAVRFTASQGGQPANDLGTVTLPVPAGGSARARVTWTPPSAGTWLIQATAPGDGTSASPVEAVVAEPNRAGVMTPWLISGLPVPAMYLVGAILGAAVLLAAALGILLWPSNRKLLVGLARPERDRA